MLSRYWHRFLWLARKTRSMVECSWPGPMISNQRLVRPPAALEASGFDASGCELPPWLQAKSDSAAARITIPRTNRIAYSRLYMYL
jgi:hypothetical protein